MLTVFLLYLFIQITQMHQPQVLWRSWGSGYCIFIFNSISENQKLTNSYCKITVRRSCITVIFSKYVCQKTRV